MKPKIFDYYILVYKPTHPRAVAEGYIPEQILIAEEVLGRFLTADEDVRHINGNPHDNSASNLEIISLVSEYRTLSVSHTDAVKLQKTSTRTFVPSKLQKPCWKEIRAPIARLNKVYLPYICLYQSEGDIYKCSHFWNYLEKGSSDTIDTSKSTKG